MADDATTQAAEAAPKNTRAARKPAETDTAAPSAKAAKAVTQPETATARDRVLKVHHLRPAPGARKERTRVGRGEGSKGKTAGRGTKGTGARKQVSPAFEGGQMPIHMRLPKLKGFRSPFKVEYQVVNLDRLAELFPQGGTVTVDDLVSAGAVRKNSLVKVLGSGDVSVKLDVTAHAFSSSARDKITAAGGSATTL